MNITNLSLFEDEFNDEELDLISLVSTNANDLNQYLVFKGSNDHSYAIGLSKIEEVLIYDESIEVIKNSDTQSLVMGSADIRESITSLIYFDRWFGNELLEDDRYELIILTNYGGHKLGIIVKDVANITTIESEAMNYDAKNGINTLFMSKIVLDKEEQMCTIFDSDKLLLDVFDPNVSQSIFIHPSKKEHFRDINIIYVDDSLYLLGIVEKLFKELETNYTLLHNGRELIDYLQQHQSDIDLIIMDLDMPKCGAIEVLPLLRDMPKYEKCKVLLHTNLAKSIDTQQLLALGVDSIDTTFNPTQLCDSMLRELSR